MCDGNMLVMSNAMVDVLRSAGVDNIDCYTTIVRDDAEELFSVSWAVEQAGMACCSGG